MPITGPQAWRELTRLKLLGPSGNKPGIFIVDQTPFVDEDEETVASSKFDLIAGRILPTAGPYNKGAYRLEMTFSAEYPFKPPEVRFATPIYHLNVDKDGLMCLPIIRATELWNPNTSLADVVKAIVAVIDNPKIEYAMSPEIQKEYQENRAEYERQAAEMVRTKSLPRS